MHVAARRGFTLVELSIVLVILGLLVGGVLAGQSLIHAAELRAITTERTNFVIAMGAFKEKYMAIPGDMNNATAFWGAADADPGTCAALTTASTGTETCNGDGNGYVAGMNLTNPHEFFRSWQHLANAGLIEGTYSGVAGPANVANGIIGTNIPRSRVPSGGWMMIGGGTMADVIAYEAANGEIYVVNYGNGLLLGSLGSDDLVRHGVVTAADAWNIDSKTDDGKPNSGKMLTYARDFSPDCVDATDAAYDLANTSNGCQLIFITGY